MTDTPEQSPKKLANFHFSERARKIILALLLIFGVQAWLIAGRGLWGKNYQLFTLAVCVAVFLIPPVNRLFARLIERLMHPTARQLWILTSAIGVVSFGFFYVTAVEQQRALGAVIHDELMHLVQMQMLARGRLVLPEHPVADSFETFFVFVKPVYAAIHFPGTAILYVPGIWLHLPKWLLPMVTCSAVVGLVFAIVSRMVHGAAGSIAALMMLGIVALRNLSPRVMSHSVIVLFGLCLIAAWMRWRGAHQRRWALLIGLFAGWAAITRPVDAIAFLLPVGIAMLFDLKKIGWRRFLAASFLVILGATPFLLLQLYFNQAVTGEYFETPYRRYVEIFHPNAGFGVDTSTVSRPQTTLPQKLDYYDTFIKAFSDRFRQTSLLELWTEDRLPLLSRNGLPNPLMIVLIPLSIMAIRSRGRWVLWSVGPMFIALYALHPFVLDHYAAVIAPSLVLAILLGAEALARSFAAHEVFVRTFVLMSLAGLSIASLPQFDRVAFDEATNMPTMNFDSELRRRVRTPAIVLYRWSPSASSHEEPVYNTDVAWPDDAPVIRAHDRGPEQNQKLFKYYAKMQPERRVYLVDRADLSLHDLGPVTALARSGDASITRPVATTPTQPTK